MTLFEDKYRICVFGVIGLERNESILYTLPCVSGIADLWSTDSFD